MDRLPGGDATCPRCGAAFHCGVDDPAPCVCTTIRLDAQQLAALRARYASCLCIGCLAAIARGEPAGAPTEPGTAAA